VGPEARRAVGALAFIHGLVHGNILAIPVFLALAWSREFHLDPVSQGGLAAVAYVGFGVSSVPFGRLADRGRAMEILSLCVAGIAAAMAAVSLSETLPALAVSLAALGVASGAYHPTGLAFISRHVPEQGRGMGWHGMGGSLGIAIGPAATGALIAVGVPWRSVAALLAVPAIVAFSLLWVRRPAAAASSRTPPDVREALRSLATPAFLPVLLVYMLAGISYWGSLTFLPGIVGTGFYVVLLSLGALGQVVSGHLADRSRPARTLFAMSVLAAAVLATLATGVPLILVAGAWGFGFLLFSLEPLQNTLVTRAVPPESRGLAFGFTFLSVFGIGSGGAVIAGALLASNQSAALFLVLAGCLALSGLCAWLSENRRRTRRGG